MGQPIAGDGNAARFALRRGPDGVYRVDGRVIPVCYDAAGCVDDGKPVVAVHSGINDMKRRGGAVLGVYVEE